MVYRSASVNADIPHGEIGRRSQAEAAQGENGPRRYVKVLVRRNADNGLSQGLGNKTSQHENQAEPFGKKTGF